MSSSQFKRLIAEFGTVQVAYFLRPTHRSLLSFEAEIQEERIITGRFGIRLSPTKSTV